MWNIKTILNKVTLTGGVTYDLATLTTYPKYRAIYILNQTGSDIKVKLNDDATYDTVPNNSEYYQESDDIAIPCADVVKVNGTGNIVAHIQYYEYVA